MISITLTYTALSQKSCYIPLNAYTNVLLNLQKINHPGRDMHLT